MIRVQEHKLPSGLSRFDEEQIVARRSLGLRAFFAFFALFFGAGAAFTLYYWGAYRTGTLTDVVQVVAFSAVSLFSWRAAGPHELHLDLYRGTYRVTSGFPLFPSVCHGTLDEIACVCVRETRRSNGGQETLSYSVWLIWKQPRRPDTLLCGCGSRRGAADAVAGQVGASLGLPDDGAVLREMWFRNPRLRRCDDAVLAFHKSLALRVTMGLLGKGLTIACLLLSGALALSGGGLHLQAAATNPSWLLLDVLGLLCLRAAGPQDLEVDLNARTYRYRAGFPGLVRTRNGDLDDIAALNTDPNRDTGSFRVQLVWTQRRRRPIILGEFRSRVEADAHRRFLETRLLGPGQQDDKHPR